MLQSNEIVEASAQEIEIFLNRPQMLVYLVNARVTVLEWGRGTGKTSMAVAPKVLNNMYNMQRSVGAFAGKSYQKLLSQMIQELVITWERFGLVRDEDFVICKAPPKSFKKSVAPPENFKYHITTKWGSGFHLIGFDHSSTSNGLTIDWLALDEAKQLPYDRIQAELLPTLRGHNYLFGDKPEHLSIIISTDGKIGPKDSDWIKNYKSQSSPDEDILMIVALSKRIEEETNEKIKSALIVELHKRQRECVYYSQASSVENLPILGVDYFKNQTQNLPPPEYMESLLNMKVKKVTGAFYNLLDEFVHLYEPATNYRYLERIGGESFIYERDCEADKDWRTDLPLKIGIDLGGHNQWFVINQLYNDTYYCIKQFQIKSPLKYKDGVDMVCKYYSKHKNKKLYLAYDAQANKENARNAENDAKEIISMFQSKGWTVINMTEDKNYINHNTKHKIWLEVLDERPSRNKRFPKFRCNNTNAENVFLSMAKAKIKEGKHGEKHKDKSSELPTSKIPPELATHFSDAQDNIVCYDLLHLITDDGIELYH